MLKLKLDNYVCDLGDISISLVRTSPYPLMASGLNGGNFVFNFSIPATPELKKTLQFAHRPNARVKTVEVPYQLYIAGLQYSGTAQIAEAERFSYEVFCPVENGDFNIDSKAIKLNEIDMGEKIVLDDQLLVIADTGASDININDLQMVSFEYEIDLPFSTINVNTGELNTAGTVFTANSSINITLTFLINFEIIHGNLYLVVYKNNIPFADVILNDSNGILCINQALENGDEITWKLRVVAQEVQQPGLYDWVADMKILPVSTFDVYLQEPDPKLLAAAEQLYPLQNFAVFPIHNPYVFDKWPDEFYQVNDLSIKEVYENYFRVINYFADGNFKVMMKNYNEEGSFALINLLIPFPYVAFIIKQIALHFNYNLINNPFEEDLKQAVLINHFVENRFIINYSKNLAISDEIDLKNHVPDWTVYDFLDHLCKLFGLGYEVNNELRNIHFHFLNDILISDEYVDISEMVVREPSVLFEKKIKGYRYQFEIPDNDKSFDEVTSMVGINVLGTVDTLNDLPSVGQFNDAYFVNMFQRYMVWDYDSTSNNFGWIFHSRHFVDKVVEGNEVYQEIKTNLCPLMQRTVTDHFDIKRLWSIPFSHQAGEFSGVPASFIPDWKPAIIWYHGMRNDGEFNAYPFASYDIYDLNKKRMNVPFAIALDGEDNLFDHKWKNYLNWRLDAKPVKIKIQPSMEFLRNFRFAKKVRFNGSNYLVADMRGNIKRNGPDVFELTLLLC